MTEYKAIKLMNNGNEYCFPKSPCFLDILLVGGGGGGGPSYNACSGGGGGGGGVRQLIKEGVYDDTFTITVGAGGAVSTQTGYDSFGNPGCPSCIVASDNSTKLAVCGGGPGGGDVLRGWGSHCCSSGGSGGGAVGFSSGISGMSMKNSGWHIGCGIGNTGGETALYSCLGIAYLGGGGGGAGDAGCSNNCCGGSGRGGKGLSLTGDYGGWSIASVSAGGGGGGCNTCGAGGSGGGGYGGRASQGCNATCVGGGGGGGGGASGCCYAGGAGCRGEVRIRYPKDGSYGFSCATGGTKGSITFNGKEYWIHSFTTAGTCTFTICY